MKCRFRPRVAQNSAENCTADDNYLLMVFKMNSIIRKTLLLALFVALSLPPITLSQKRVGGRPVISGLWNTRAVKCAAGGLAIKVKGGYKAADLASTFGKFHSRIKQDFDDLGWGWIEFPDRVDVMSVISDLQKNGAVGTVEPNFIGEIHLLPNDPYFSGTSPATFPYQWALRNTGQVPPGGTIGADIDATDAWNLATGSSNV